MRGTIEEVEESYNLVKRAESIKNENALNKFIGKESDANFTILLNFYDDFPTISRMLYNDMQDKEKIELTNKLKYICKWVISNRGVFENSEYYAHIPDAILDLISEREGSHTFSLMMDGDINDFYAEKEHMKFRGEIEDIIKQKREEQRSSAENRYVDRHDNYHKNFFSYSMNLLERNIFNIPEDVLIKFLSELENTGYFDKIFEINNDKLSFEDENLVYQYVRFVLKVKSIFKPEELLNDKLINGVFSGKIKNENIINLLLSNKETKSVEENQKKKVGNPFDFVEVFSELLEREGKDTDHFYKNLVSHFKSVKMDDKNINKILRELIDSDGHYNALQYLADEDLDSKEDFIELVRDADPKKDSYLTVNSYLFTLLKQKEKELLENKTIYIPFDYAIKNVEHLPNGVCETLQTYIEEELYDEKECEELENKMKENSLYRERKDISYEMAKELIRDNMENGIQMNEEIFKDCLRSIIKTTAEKYGIDSDVVPFFGEGQTRDGFVSSQGDMELIWINDKLIRNFINTNANTTKKIEVFSTLFHEIRHIKQHDEMRKGKLDFLTYNFIKESIIREVDANFYKSNYYKLFTEEDARQFGIIDSMKFIKALGISDFDKIYEEYKKDLKGELDNSNIREDAVKKVPFRNVEAINISDYIGKIIKSNPEVINKYNGILNIEYKRDGTRKKLEEILEEYNQINSEDEQESKYSIYYGIIKQLYETADKDKLEPDAKEKITDFFEKKRNLISFKDFRNYSKKSNPTINKIILNMLDKEIRREPTERGSIIQEEKLNGDDGNERD